MTETSKPHRNKLCKTWDTSEQVALWLYQAPHQRLGTLGPRRT